jgi:arginine N-succinyltransferase
VIGRVHPETEPAVAILREEGFDSTGMVDIFEAGPIVGCPRDSLRLVRESFTDEVAAITAQPAAPGDHLVGTRGVAFRACRTSLNRFPDGGVALPRETATALGVHVGDSVRCGRLWRQP